MTKAKLEIGHLCPACVNAVFWLHREAMEKAFNILNTPGEDASVRVGGAQDIVFECLSFFDLYYDACLTHRVGTLKENEVWVEGGEAARGSKDPCIPIVPKEGGGLTG